MGETPKPAAKPPPSCPGCGKAMTLAQTVPRLGPHPELRSFHCVTCREVATIPIDDR